MAEINRLARRWCAWAAIACVLGLGGECVGQATAGADAAAGTPPGLAAAAAVEQAVVEAIAGAEKSVVAIARERKPRPRTPDDRGDDDRIATLGERTPDDPDYVPSEYGTGVVIDRAGLIVTNYHVIGDPKQNRYWVWVNRRPYAAEVKAADPWLDLAVLKIDAEPLEPIKFANAKTVRRGQIVVSLGNPHAIARDGQPSATWGIVANLARKAPAAPRSRVAAGVAAGETLHQYGTLIQTDCRLQLGTSGGALINLRGEMIGLTTALAALEGDDAAAGFAIPVDEAFRNTLEALKAGRKAEYGFLGVAPELLGVAQRQQGRGGVRVRQIIPGTPAARSELRENDIVTQVAGIPVADPAELIRELSKWPAEAQLQLTVLRFEGKTPRSTPVTVQLSKKYLSGPPWPYSQQPDPQWRGMRVDYATAIPLFGNRVRDADPEGCVAVLDVERDSPSWKAGLRPGDFVTHVGDQRVGRPVEFFAALQGKDGPIPLRITGVAERESRKIVAPQ